MSQVLSPGRNGAEAAGVEDLRDEKKRLSNELKGLVQVFNALVSLNVALAKAGSGAFLAFPNPQQPGTVIPFNKRHLKNANSRFANSIKALKKHLTASKKKSKSNTRPESFSGVYTPLYAAEALRTFFTRAPELFGPLDPITAAQTQQAGEGVMARLPQVQAGFCLRNTVTMLFYIYAHANNLQYEENGQFARSDENMNFAFGGQIAAAYFSARGPDGKPVKMLMDEAVAQRLVTGPLNTYDTIRYSRPDFDPQRFNTYFFQNIASANYYSKNVINSNQGFAEVAAAINSDQVRAQMLAEHNTVKEVSARWKALLEPGRKQVKDARKRQQDAARRAQRQNA